MSPLSITEVHGSNTRELGLPLLSQVVQLGLD